MDCFLKLDDLEVSGGGGGGGGGHAGRLPLCLFCGLAFTVFVPGGSAEEVATLNPNPRVRLGRVN